tara:strand:+ start:664 stop:1074 length:411 start_codon:yes stop_codon:yes gene_type:complete
VQSDLAAPPVRRSGGVTHTNEVRTMNPSSLFHPVLAGVSAVLLVAVTACSSEPGAVYVDTWQSVDPNDTSVVTIERNNDNFRVDFNNDGDPSNDLFLHIENGALVAWNKTNGSGMKFTYIEPSDQLKWEATGTARV